MITVQLQEKRDLSKQTFELKLKLLEPLKISFQAGQFVAIKFITPENKTFYRQYSIANPPTENDHILLCIKRVAGGMGTSQLAVANINQVFEILGPQGKFVLSDDLIKDKVFLSVGAGIAPFKSMIQDLLPQKTGTVFLYQGFRSDIYYQEFFNKLKSEYPKFDYLYSLSRPINGDWNGLKGRITKHLINNIEKHRGAEFYLCGSGVFVEEMRGLLISHHIPEADIIYERYN